MMSFQAITNGALPVSLNWASSNNPVGYPVVPPVHNQGLCGACWAFVSAAAVESAIKIKLNRRLSLSVQELVDCDRKFNKGCYGGDPASAFRYIAANGISTWEEYPYIAKDGQCHVKRSHLRAYIEGVANVIPFSEISLMASLAFFGPVATGICGTDNSFLYYQSGVFVDDNCCKELNHAVLIIGYGHDNKLGVGYWIIQNSWGQLWGENGFMRIARSKNGDGPGYCGIDTVPSIPYGAYIVDDTGSNSTDQSSNTESDLGGLDVMWESAQNWILRHWRSAAALLSSALLTVSVLILLYSVYIDRYISTGRDIEYSV